MAAIELHNVSKGPGAAPAPGAANVHRIVLDVTVAHGCDLWGATAALLARTGLSGDEIIECIGCDKAPLTPECLITLCSLLKIPGCQLLDVEAAAFALC